jgi:hypothetical protein
MNRAFLAGVVAALALPVLALAALVGEQEYLLTHGTILNVPIRGYDPRDLLKGRYINGQLDFDWQRRPDAADASAPVDGAVCVLASDGPKPRVRFLDGWTKGDPVDAECRMVIAGRGWKGGPDVPARFAPTSLDNGRGGMKLFVPETRAGDLEKLMIDRLGALSVDLAVRPDGGASIAALRVDGKVLGAK